MLLLNYCVLDFFPSHFYFYLTVLHFLPCGIIFLPLLISLFQIVLRFLLPISCFMLTALQFYFTCVSLSKLILLLVLDLWMYRSPERQAYHCSMTRCVMPLWGDIASVVLFRPPP